MKHRIANRNLPQLLLTARDQLMAHFRPILNQFGITEQQWRILRVLDEHGQLEPRELCEQCQILSPSMAGVLARMEDVRLVTRERMATDQRRVIVRMTTTGDRLLGEIAPLIAEQYEHIDAAYGHEVLDNLYAALQAFMRAEQDGVPQVELPPRARPARVRTK
ncbi:MAG: homoprotocatechuate degradation operon regulator HpaR [Telluria sp.]